jgi:broad specificity phosphatase PhoE
MACFAIVSHHARMRCFLNKWLEGPNNQYNILKMKFNNASVLEIYFGGMDDIHIKVVWSGEKKGDKVINFQEGNYVGGKPYANKDMSPQTYRFKRFPNAESQFRKIEGKTFFAIRHGEGVHNAASKWSKYMNPSIYKDAELTQVGEIQASNAGLALKHHLEIEKKSIDMFFVSDLQRTHQTCRKVLQTLYGNGAKPQMYILPCLYELSEGCDSHWKNIYTAYENATLNYGGPDIVQTFNLYPDSRTNKRSKKYCETLNVFVQAVITYETVFARQNGMTVEQKRKQLAIAHKEANLLEEKYNSGLSENTAKEYSNEYEEFLKENPTLSALPIGRSTKLLKNADTFKDLTNTEEELFNVPHVTLSKKRETDLFGAGLSRSFLTRRNGRKKTQRSKRKRTRRK